MQKNIDIQENSIYEIDEKLLEILLKDRSSKKNIIWATDNYAMRGKGYQEYDHIAVKSITGRNGLVIKPRIKKSKREQQIRIKKKAEVFTPSWICNKQNNELDKIWFERENVFNTESGDSWKTNYKKIIFSDLPEKTWKDYVKQKALEITCGEAPYLASRYDTVSGEWIDIQDRIGALDRKLRVVGENTQTEDEWYEWVVKAYKSTFGYEWQGDSLLIARENLLFTFIDYYFDRFKKQPSNEQLIEIAKILSWNLWQMDGLKHVVPNSCKPIPKFQLSFFEDMEKPDECTGCEKGNSYKHTGIYCKIKNWKTNRTILFNNIKGRKGMKFDFIIGNPPYQETINKTDAQTQANTTWIYQDFQNAADKISRFSCLIYPFGGWFDSPTRLGGLGNRILKDGRTILIRAYEGTSDKRAWYRNDKLPNPVFGNDANLSAGVSIVLRSENIKESFEYSNRIYSDDVVKIKTSETYYLTPNPLFASINKKLGNKKLISQVKKGIFGIESNFVENNPEKVSFNINDWNNPIQLLTNDKAGSAGRATLYWTDKPNIVKGNKYLDHYKVLIASAYPKKSIISGDPTIENVKKRINELVEILPPNSAFGRSRMALYMSKSKTECDNFIKYMNTSFFAGLMLQEPNRSSTIGDIIPIQNYSASSDIDWSKTIDEIDIQLYKKYNLTDKEISFIKSE